MVLLLVAVANGYPTGAPKKACKSMEPEHGYGISPQHNYAPYSISVNSTTYTPNGKPIKGKIHTQSTLTFTRSQFFKYCTYLNCFAVEINGNSLKGLLLQARKVGSNQWWNPEPIGWFENYNLPPGTQVLECSSYADSITHLNDTTKYTPLTFIWHPPSDSAGNINFLYATVLLYQHCIKLT